MSSFSVSTDETHSSKQAIFFIIPNRMKNIEILRMTGELKPQRLKQTNKYFFLLQTTEYLPYYKHKCLDSEPSTFLLVNRYIIFNKFDKDIKPHRIIIYTGNLPGQGSQT